MKTNNSSVIAIKGAYGLENFGDDTLMVAVYKIGRKIFPSSSFELICKDANYISTLIPGVKVVSPEDMHSNYPDLIIYGGGTQFYSFPISASTNAKILFKKIIRNARNPLPYCHRLFRKIATGKSVNKQIVAFGLGLGPFNDNSSKMQNAKKLLADMLYVAVRDVNSYKLCKEWECKNVNLRSDLCYLPELWDVHVKKDKAGKVQRIGIIPRDWPHTEEGNSYASSLFKVVEQMRSDGKDVEFISFCGRYDTNWGQYLKERNEKFIQWDPQKYSISEFLNLLSRFDVFITARYHGAIFASILGKPAICIEVEQKLQLVADLLGYGARLWSYPFDVSECLNHISKIEDNYSLATECLANVVKEQGTLVEKIIIDYKQLRFRSPQD